MVKVSSKRYVDIRQQSTKHMPPYPRCRLLSTTAAKELTILTHSVWSPRIWFMLNIQLYSSLYNYSKEINTLVNKKKIKKYITKYKLNAWLCAHYKFSYYYYYHHHHHHYWLIDWYCTMVPPNLYDKSMPQLREFRMSLMSSDNFNFMAINWTVCSYKRTDTNAVCNVQIHRKISNLAKCGVRQNSLEATYSFSSLLRRPTTGWPTYIFDGNIWMHS